MPTNLEYKIALGYSALGTTGWLAVGFRQWGERGRYLEGARRLFAEGDGELGRRATEEAGARLTEVVVAAALVVVFAIAFVALVRRTWNAWDWATAGAGLATVLSLVFLCASRRVIFAAPFTLAPFWLLLYRPGVKAACAVGETTVAAGETDDELLEAVDLRAEQARLAGLRQSLQVFEIERGISTDEFVARYARGHEEDSADNEEWFTLARMARRTEERIAGLNGHQSGQG